jgi:hypothetical protein
LHGLIFASLRDYTVQRLGEEHVRDIWSDRIFELTEAYDDEWFAAQLERLAVATGEPLDEVQRAFGSFAAQETFLRLFPDYYEANEDAFAFLLGIEEKIHEVVRATIVGANPPRLHVQQLSDLGVLISYTSDRKLCRLLEGLVRGMAAYYGDDVVMEEIQCTRRGDAGCVFTVVRC